MNKFKFILSRILPKNTLLQNKVNLPEEKIEPPIPFSFIASLKKFPLFLVKQICKFLLWRLTSIIDIVTSLNFLFIALIIAELYLYSVIYNFIVNQF